ncbi:MAG TPA: DUF116 domain-containing protein [Ignavibacteriaceae bacterium]|nr:DUF116 domain-containing protein [Ignavibacteriaceae bacterium]
MQPVTYSLKCGKSNSEDYYSEISTFADIVMDKASASLFPIVEDYINYLNTYNLEDIREKEEYILELLSFGVLWRSYSGQALAVHIAPFITLAKMSEWRKKHQRIKPFIDLMRGVLLSLFMLPGERRKSPDIPTLIQIDHVCKWFEATGEFREQALRFIRWRAFWSNKSEEEVFKIFYLIDEFTNWFDETSTKFLGKYTDNVEKFLSDSDKRYRWREDRVSCTRARIEYHLNMVGAELMNRAFRTEFLKVDTKVVLVPGCMRGKPEGECEAVKVKEGLICNDCLPACKVNQLRKLGKKYKDDRAFDVYIIPHASDLSLWSPKSGRPVRGVVASACVTTLVEGGWELKRYNVPAQCVLLDCSGCKKHWYSEGIPTMLNVRELKRRIFEDNKKVSVTG